MNKIKQVLVRIRGFFGEVGTEIKKCTWPTWAELYQSTVVVIVSVAILTVFVGISDWVMLGFLSQIVR